MNEHPPMDETSFSGAWQDSTLPDLDSLGFEDSNSFNLDELDFDSMSSFDLRPIDNLDPNLLQSIDAEVPAHFRLPEEMYDVLFQGVQCQYYTPTTEPVYSLTCPSMTSSMEVNAPSMSFFLPPANQDQLAVDNDPQDRLYYDAEQQMIVNAIPSEPVIHRSQSPPQSCEDQATQTPTSLSSTEGYGVLHI
ncbi:hypothetical protein S40293_10776 [Stachybotrys chartarum IBT 40293]|nr:hypothetical protein S40293_10776 [Stachybotrys chartarum IBT 40293]